MPSERPECRFNPFYASAAWRYARPRQLFDHPLCEYLLDDDR